MSDSTSSEEPRGSQDSRQQGDTGKSRKPPGRRKPAQHRSRKSTRPRKSPRSQSGSRARTDGNETIDELGVEAEFGVPFAGTILPAEQWAKTALKRLPESGKLDLAELFGREAPRLLDIGCGNGRFLLASAVRRPEMDHLGIDALPMVIRYATRRANMRGLSNCRLAVCDGLRFLERYCPPSSLTEIHVIHPQPFPDPNEHGLRLFQHEFLWLVHQALVPGGKLFVQTDNAAYWRYLQTVLPAIVQWHQQEGPWPEDPQGRSRREIVAIHKGLQIYRGWGVRRDELSRSEFEAACELLPQPDFDARHDRNPKRWRRN